MRLAKRAAAGRGAENRGLDIQIHGLGIALVACVAAIVVIRVAPALTLLVLLPLLAAWAWAWRVYGRADTWMRGAAGERAVGRELEKLETAGWRTRHDVMKSAGGNVDHVVVGPGGVFAIETKLNTFGKAGVRQAHAHARYLRKTLGAEVVPVICLADRRSAPKVYAEVWCMGKPHLAAFLLAQPPRPVSAELLDRL